MGCRSTICHVCPTFGCHMFKFVGVVGTGDGSAELSSLPPPPSVNPKPKPRPRARMTTAAVIAIIDRRSFAGVRDHHDCDAAPSRFPIVPFRWLDQLADVEAIS